MNQPKKLLVDWTDDDWARHGASTPATGGAVSRETITRVPIDQVVDNPWQNRMVYGDLDDLAADIARNGLLQPPIARPTDGGVVQIAFGHRRLRACRQAGMEKFPVFLHALSDEQMAEYAWSENEKRSDTTPIEKARHIERVQCEFGWTQVEIAERFGVSRPVIANLLRLLELGDEAQAKIQSGELSQAHGRFLLRLADAPELQAQIATDAAAQGTTTRELEALVEQHRKRMDAEAQWLRQVGEVDALGLGVPWAERMVRDTSVFFPGHEWAASELLASGACGPQCECLRLVYLKDDDWLMRNGSSDGMVRPCASARNVVYVCSNDKQARAKWLETNNKDKAAELERKQAEREEMARRQREEMARRQRVVDGLIINILAIYSLEQLWNDPMFWKFAAKKVRYGLADCMEEKQTLAEMQETVLRQAVVAKSQDKEFGYGIDIAATFRNKDTLYAALGHTQATGETAA